LPATQWETLQYLRDSGFPVSREVRYCADLEAALKECGTWIENAIRSSLKWTGW